MRSEFFKLYWKIKRIIVPTLESSQHLYGEILNSHVNGKTRWLDVGCGHHILPPWRIEEEKRLVRNCQMVIGLDPQEPSLKKHQSVSFRICGNISNIPFRSESFDLVTANMVLEHVKYPYQQLLEVSRVLRPGGMFIFHTPNIYGYTTIISRLIPELIKKKLIRFFEGRDEEDAFRTFYKVNERKGIRQLAEATGFDKVQIKMTVSEAQFIVIPPLVIFELFFIRLLMKKVMKPFRTNIIGILQKSSG